MAPTTFRLLDTGINDGRWNVALDQVLIDAHRAGQAPDTLRFLRFTPSVLVGRHQDLSREIDVDYCARHGIDVGRRVTGGGALYLDPQQLGWELVCTRAALGGGSRWPTWGEWIAVLLLTVAVSASALVASWLVIPALAVAAIMLPAVFGIPQRTAWGFGLFARAPLRGILLTLMTVALVALLWFAALMFGFFVTGWVGAALTWLVFGVVGAFILATWFATPRRDRA